MTIYEQIQKSIEHIEDNLFSKLTSGKVAKAAFMSVRSFYNYFWSVSGYSYKEYVIKRRLTEAMKALAGSKKSVLDVALDTGYESHEAFSRAFKKEFQLSPFAFRKELPKLKGLEKIKLIKEIYMGVIVKELPEMRAACFEAFAPDSEIKAHDKLAKWVKKNLGEKIPYRNFGHNIDREGKLSHDPNNEGYKVYATIDEEFVVKDKAKVETIEAGKFVVTGIEGNFADDPRGNWITQGWQNMVKMIEKKGNRVKPPGKWYEEKLEPSKPENLRLDLYLEIE